MSTVNGEEKKLGLGVALLRGLRRRCPRCGLDSMFEPGHRYQLKVACGNCGCEFRAREADTYFFMYVSTAALTGVFLIAMLLIRPRNVRLAQAGLLVVATLVMFGTLPFRKGMAIAWDVFVGERFP